MVLMANARQHIHPYYCECVCGKELADFRRLVGSCIKQSKMENPLSAVLSDLMMNTSHA